MLQPKLYSFELICFIWAVCYIISKLYAWNNLKLRVQEDFQRGNVLLILLLTALSPHIWARICICAYVCFVLFGVFCFVFLQCLSPRGVPQCSSSERHRQWPDQPVHHDPVAASAWKPPERHPQGLHRPVRSPFRPQSLVFVFALPIWTN